MSGLARTIVCVSFANDLANGGAQPFLAVCVDEFIIYSQLYAVPFCCLCFQEQPTIQATILLKETPCRLVIITAKAGILPLDIFYKEKFVYYSEESISFEAIPSTRGKRILRGHLLIYV